jgi:hypothetical protein
MSFWQSPRLGLNIDNWHLTLKMKFEKLKYYGSTSYWYCVYVDRMGG